ncbi:MAG: DsbA family protein [Candidatus Peribacteraceae bacterium]|nr:DsbA family protein [Candidatus Peribacteraceae bacterium]
MNTSRFSLTLATLSLAFVACGPVDTTGLSATSSRTPAGNADGFVTVMEYADFQCPACKSAHELISKPLVEKYASNIRFEFKHFPLQGIHPYAMEAAQAAECAADQGKFWEFVDINYKNQANLNSSALRTWAAELKLDTALFDRCLKSGIKKAVVDADYAQGEALGVNSTPTYFVNGVKVPVNGLDTITAAIDEALKQQTSTPL